MIELINAVTGTTMWVHEDRLEQYLAAGHRPAVRSEKEPAEKPVRKTTKKK